MNRKRQRRRAHPTPRDEEEEDTLVGVAMGATGPSRRAAFFYDRGGQHYAARLGRFKADFLTASGCARV